MPEPTQSTEITIRATFISYIVLGGIWVILALGYLTLTFLNPGKGLETGALIAGTVALLWWAWLRGFKITVSDAYFEYRDGFFRSSKIPMGKILKMKDEWVKWDVFGQTIKIPRVAVISRDGKKLININPKPFGHEDFRRVREKFPRQQ